LDLALSKIAEIAKAVGQVCKEDFMKHILSTLVVVCMSSAAFASSAIDHLAAESQLEGLSLTEATAVQQIDKLHDSENPLLDVESKDEVKAQKPKILIAGDSWAFFSCIYNSMGKMIKDKKAPLSEDNRCWRTSRTGMTAAEWPASNAHKRVIRYLKTSPRIKYLYLSLGGNDMMHNWNQDFTAEQELDLFVKTTDALQKTMDTYLAIRPDLKIILAGYDFPNFTFKFTFPLYRNLYHSMHRPSPHVVNSALVRFTQYMSQLNNGKNIFYVHSIGLAQYYYGVPEKGLKPGETTPPEEISPMDNPGAVGGITNLQNSRRSMIDWLFILRDAFHLNTRMYRRVMHHAYDNLIVHLLRQDQLENESQQAPLMLQTAN
jgi:hypothetical protein